MDRDRELRRLESLVIKMRERIVELHNYNKVMRLLNSISDDKSLEGVLKILTECFSIDGSSLMVKGENGLETIAFYGSHQPVQSLTGKGALFFASVTLTDGKTQAIKTEGGTLLSLPIIHKRIGDLGVLNLFRGYDLSDESFPETDKRLFADIANQIGVTLGRVLFRE